MNNDPHLDMSENAVKYRENNCECYGKNEDLESGLLIIYKERCPIHKQPIVNQSWEDLQNK